MVRGPQGTIAVGDTLIINTGVAKTAEDQLAQYGINEHQTVTSADGKDVYLVRDLVRDAWFQAMWKAYRMSPEQMFRWLLNDKTEEAKTDV